MKQPHKLYNLALVRLIHNAIALGISYPGSNDVGAQFTWFLYNSEK